MSSAVKLFLSKPRNLLYVVAAGLIIVQIGVFSLNEKYFWGVLGALMGGAILFIDYQYLWYLGLALFPVSINMEEYFPSVSIVFPSDLLAIGLMFILIYKLRDYADDLWRIGRHPMLLTFGLYLLWMLVTAFTSVRPTVSHKYWLSAVWYFAAFYLFSIVFLKRKADLVRSWYLIAGPLALVMGFTLFKHGLKGFSILSSYEIMQPFYKEHTAYAASIVIFVPAYALLTFQKGLTLAQRLLLAGMAALTLAATMASFTRGAWLGLMASVGLVTLVYFWKRYKLIVGAGVVSLVILGLILSQTQFYFTADADKRSKGVFDRIVSSFNTSTDLSNRERFNRWACAVEMIEEKPFFGFGPGTYAMEYAPYQQARNRTLVSTNQGNIGSAHNEFLLAGAEMGLPGVLIVLLFYLTSVWRAIRGYLVSPDPQRRLLYLVSLAGLVTYYVHALVNNFLDQDKVCIPVYLCMATIVALDVYHRNEETDQTQPNA